MLLFILIISLCGDRSSEYSGSKLNFGFIEVNLQSFDQYDSEYDSVILLSIEKTSTSYSTQYGIFVGFSGISSIILKVH
jgi:hypothetical protein